MKTRKRLHTLLPMVPALFVSWSASVAAFGAEFLWRASSGMFPNEVQPPMLLLDGTATPEQPYLSQGALVISTDDRLEQMFYEHVATNLDMPTQLVIEAEIQFVSGVSIQAGRAPVMIGFRTAPYVGGALCIDQDTVSLSHGSGVAGPSASVDTDDSFHVYRIEVDDSTTPGTPLRVYQDGTLILTDTLLGSGANVAPYTDIWFGEGTGWAYGTSRWRSFRHNAAREPEHRPVMSIRVSEVEICWTSRTNILYDVQYRSDLTTNTWVNLFTNIVGTGTENCVLDAVARGQPQRYYRVQVLQ